MFDLVATGTNPDQHWRRRAPAGRTIRLGRAPLDGWAVPWDLRISREHADLMLVGERLEVRCLENARNPIYRHEQPARQFEVGPGEEFRIGGTVFRLERVSAFAPSARPGPPADSPIASEVELLKAQVAALQAQLTAFVAARNRELEAPPSRADAELEQLRAQVEALKRQLAQDRRPAEDKDRQIVELKAQLEQMRAQTGNPPRHDAADSHPRGAHEASPPDRPNVEALKARLEAQAAAKRQLRQRSAKGRADDDSIEPGSPSNGVRGSERRSTLFVLKAQIEAQAAKLRREGQPAAAKSGDSRQSDVEALKALLEARAAEQAQVLGEAGERWKSDSSRRSSHIAALLALHDARAAARDAADRSWHDDSADETDDLQTGASSDAEPGRRDETPQRPVSLAARVWRELPGDAQEVVREIASGFVVDDGAKARIASALNRLLIGRGFLTDAELQRALQSVAGEDRPAGRRWSEAALRRAARYALAGVLPGLPARKSAAPPSAAAVQLHRGQCFGIAEIITGRVHAATYVAAAPPECSLPVQLVRIDSGLVLQLRETSPEFRAAWDRARL